MIHDSLSVTVCMRCLVPESVSDGVDQTVSPV